MKRFVVYTHLQFKRAMHCLPFLFLSMLVLCLCLALAVTAITENEASSADQQRIGIGIVGDFESQYLGLGLSALQSFDSSRFFLDIEKLDEEEARNKLFDGELAGYAVVPEGFVDEAMHGKVGKLRFVTTDANVDLIHLLKQEVLTLISCVLVESQNGIYGMQDALAANGISDKTVSDLTDEMAVEYMGLILNRSNALQLDVIGISDGLSWGGYLFSAFCILLLLLSGIVCCPLFARQDHALFKRISARQYHPATQVMGEYLSFFLIMASCLFLLVFLMLIGSDGISQAIPELAGQDVLSLLAILVRFIPAIALVTAMQYLLYELSGSVVSGILMQVVSAAILGYVSGCFYPISFFPKAIRLLSGVLPPGIARGYISSLLAGTSTPQQLLLLLIYTAILLTLAGLIRYHHIQKA